MKLYQGDKCVAFFFFFLANSLPVKEIDTEFVENTEFVEDSKD